MKNFYAEPASPDLDQRLWRMEDMSPEELQFLEWWENYSQDISQDCSQYSTQDVLSLLDFMTTDPSTTVGDLRRLANDINKTMEQ